jgi:HK97 family phage major capsid protein
LRNNPRGRIRAFTGPDAEQRAEKCGHYFKALLGNTKSRQWCIDRDVPFTKATGESGDVVGGFLAPTDFDHAIVAIREQMGAFRSGAEIRPSGSDSQVRPRRVGGVTANFVAEGSAIPESQLQFDAVGTAQKKLAVLCRGSAELFEDSAPDLAEFLAVEIAYAFASTEDDCGFNGDGTSTYSGISGLNAKLTGLRGAVAAASGHNTFLTIDSTDIGNLMGAVMASAISGACWYVSAVGYAQTFCRLAAVSGGLTATMRPDGTIQASFLGFPVKFSGKLPNVTSGLAGKAMMYFGDLRMSSVLVERNAQTVLAISRDRSLDTDQVLVRGVRRLDIVNHDTGDANNPGPVAMLVGTT